MNVISTKTIKLCVGKVAVGKVTVMFQHYHNYFPDENLPR